jgi:hypothetical protein
VSAAVPPQLRSDVLLAGVDDDVGTELRGKLQFLVGDVDRCDRRTGDLGALQGEVAEAADPGDRDELGRPDVGDLDRLRACRVAG